jgi:hypothetical protein
MDKNNTLEAMCADCVQKRDLAELSAVARQHEQLTYAEKELLINAIESVMSEYYADITCNKLHLPKGEYVEEYLDAVHTLEYLRGGNDYRERNGYYFMLLQSDIVHAPPETSLQWLTEIKKNIDEARETNMTYEGMVADEARYYWEYLAHISHPSRTTEKEDGEHAEARDDAIHAVMTDWFDGTHPTTTTKDTTQEQARIIEHIFSLYHTETTTAPVSLQALGDWCTAILKVFWKYPQYTTQAEIECERFSNACRTLYQQHAFQARNFLPHILNTRVTKLWYKHLPKILREDITFWIAHTIKEERENITFTEHEKKQYQQANLNIVTANTPKYAVDGVKTQAALFIHLYKEIEKKERYIQHAQYLARKVWEVRKDWTTFHTLQEAHTAHAKHLMQEGDMVAARALLHQIDSEVVWTEQYILQETGSLSISWHSHTLSYLATLAATYTEKEQGKDVVLRRMLVVAENGILHGEGMHVFPYTYALTCYAYFNDAEKFVSCLLRMFLQLYSFVRNEIATWTKNEFVQKNADIRALCESMMRYYELHPEGRMYVDSYTKKEMGGASIETLPLQKLQEAYNTFIAIDFGGISTQ